MIFNFSILLFLSYNLEKGNQKEGQFQLEDSNWNEQKTGQQETDQRCPVQTSPSDETFYDHGSV